MCLVTSKKGVKTWKTSEYSHPKDKLIVLGNGNEHNANLLIYNNQPHKSGNNRDAIEKIKSTQGQKWWEIDLLLLYSDCIVPVGWPAKGFPLAFELVFNGKYTSF